MTLTHCQVHVPRRYFYFNHQRKFKPCVPSDLYEVTQKVEIVYIGFTQEA